jgi:hypothetical protein
MFAPMVITARLTLAGWCLTPATTLPSPGAATSTRNVMIMTFARQTPVSPTDVCTLLSLIVATTGRHHIATTLMCAPLPYARQLTLVRSCSCPDAATMIWTVMTQMRARLIPASGITLAKTHPLQGAAPPPLLGSAMIWTLAQRITAEYQITHAITLTFLGAATLLRNATIPTSVLRTPVSATDVFTLT